VSSDAAESPTLSPEEKARRAASFGGIATQYERYRPGPPTAAVDWIVLPGGARTVVDLGAGTGALTRLLVGRVPDVIAVEPDDRMRAVLAEAVPSARALAGRGESMPLPDASADAVIASTSWHWMDLIPTLTEVARVLVPGGVLGVLWTGPDPEAAFMAEAQAAMRAFGQTAETSETGEPDEGAAVLAKAINEPGAGHQVLTIPPGVPFDQPERTEFKWDQALNADDLLGLLGTFSWVITMSEDKRRGLYEMARLLLQQEGIEGDATIDVGYIAQVWKARRNS
jgi:SAM-dependent methyltransferase